MSYHDITTARVLGDLERQAIAHAEHQAAREGRTLTGLQRNAIRRRVRFNAREAAYRG